MEFHIQNVTMTYPNGKQALGGLSLRLGSPSLTGLLGPNGAGKSTLIRLLSAALMPSSGVIQLDGAPLKDREIELKSRLGYLPQEFGLFDELTVYQFLDYMAALKGIRRPKSAIRQVIQEVRLEEKAGARIRTLSGGQRQRVGIAQALLGGPPLLILDEPTAGLDPKERIRIRNLISDLSQDRIVLIATHVVSDIEFISKEILLMKNGRLIDKASPEQLQAKIQGKVFEMSVGQQELEEVKEKFEISNLFRKDGQIIVRVVTQKRPEGYDEIREAAPTLEDVYLYEFEVKGAMHNNAVRKIAGT